MKKLIAILLAITGVSCQGSPSPEIGGITQKLKDKHNTQTKGEPDMDTTKTETAIFAGGCFWCTEAFFTDLKGVEKVVSGYIGGSTPNPTYREVCNGTTGHAEAIQITFNPAQVAYEDLLEIFFATHDPTTLNRQGADVGTQYRSEIFYTNDAQKAAAENFIKLLADQKIFDKPVVTKVSGATTFYAAEDYHQNYYAQNKSQPYCMAVIAPKMAKLKKNYQSKLKD